MIYSESELHNFSSTSLLTWTYKWNLHLPCHDHYENLKVYGSWGSSARIRLHVTALNNVWERRYKVLIMNLGWGGGCNGHSTFSKHYTSVWNWCSKRSVHNTHNITSFVLHIYISEKVEWGHGSLYTSHTNLLCSDWNISICSKNQHEHDEVHHLPPLAVHLLYLVNMGAQKNIFP